MAVSLHNGACQTNGGTAYRTDLAVILLYPIVASSLMVPDLSKGKMESLVK